MSDSHRTAKEEKEKPGLGAEGLTRFILGLERGSPQQILLLRFVCLNFFVLFCRPQDWPGLGVLGAARMPMLISILAMLFWLPHFNATLNRISKLLMFFLFVELSRGIVGKFFDPADTIVRNDFWQFHTWKDLFLQCTSLVFPLMVALRSERAMRMLVLTIATCGLLLGVWTATHGGKGPGGFLGDENDVCLAMVMMLPFALMLSNAFRGTFMKLFLLASAAILCAGIVSTNSRGGFLGFAAVLGLVFIRSDRKALTMAGGIVALLLAIPFIPQQYIDEIVSIRTDSQADTGTIRERLDTWEVSLRVFTDPKNTFFGVGLNNVPYWFGEYEDVDRGRYKKSLSGRAMHSIYFSLLPDLGLYGVVLIGMLWGWSIIGNRRAVSAYERYRVGLGRIIAAQGEVNKPVKVDAGYQLGVAARRLRRQAEIGRAFLKALNVAWLGTLVAGIGVSALYYPPVWFLVGCSAGLQVHAQRLARASRELGQQASMLPDA